MVGFLRMSLTPPGFVGLMIRNYRNSLMTADPTEQHYDETVDIQHIIVSVLLF